MKSFKFLALVSCLCTFMSCTEKVEEKKMSGNPVFPGWYADPEGIVFGDEYWMYPTLSLLHGEDTVIYKAELYGCCYSARCCAHCGTAASR